MEHDLLLWKLDTIQVKGRAQRSQIFEVMAEKKNAPQEQIRIKSDYEAALVLYRKGDFIQAGEAFVSLFNANNDIPSKNMSERCREYIDTPPKNWLGVAVMKEK